MRPLGPASHLSVSATGKSVFITAAILPNILLSLSSREIRILDPENVFGNPVSGLRIFGVWHFPSFRVHRPAFMMGPFA